MEQNANIPLLAFVINSQRLILVRNLLRNSMLIDKMNSLTGQQQIIHYQYITLMLRNNWD